ncbi:MAG: Flp pilus assembly complex ATPase component TadA, partial [Acidobacteria bacterium]|nr:Flp pilus assembly complex ATPase component TadA [Acidobacteriota bacterium]
MLGQTLIALGAISPEQLDRALQEQRSRGGLIGEVLVQLRYIDEDTLARGLAREAGVPYMSVNGLSPETSAVAIVPEAFARKTMIAPIALSGRVLRVAQANPFDVLSVDELQHASGHPIEPHCASRSDVQRLIDRSYSGTNELQLLARAGVHRLGASLDVAVEEAPIVRMIELMLNDAIERGATDLHIEPEEDVIRLRHRVDGVLVPWETLPKPLLPAIVSRIKVMAGLDIAEQRLPQDGRISELLNTRRVDLRISTLPTMFGEKVAIRILEKEKLVRGLEHLGFGRRNLTLVHDILMKSRG